MKSPLRPGKSNPYYLTNIGNGLRAVIPIRDCNNTITRSLILFCLGSVCSINNYIFWIINFLIESRKQNPSAAIAVSKICHRNITAASCQNVKWWCESNL